MGFDISSHPIDVTLVQSRLLPYLRGEGAIDDLVAEAVRHARVRFRANAWGLGLVALRQANPEAVPELFDPDLHVWGRPYFIAADTPQVSDAIDRYLAATPYLTDALAMAHLHALHPNLPNVVQPDGEGELPGDDALGRGIRGDLDFLRASYKNLATGKPVRTADGESADPEDLFLFTMPLAVVTFAAHLTPGWMARGHVWFTEFLKEAQLDGDGLVESAANLFEPLLKTIGGWQEAFQPTITQNYTVGGFVRPANVPAFRRYWEAHRGELVASYEADGDPHAGAVNWQKIREAVIDAERRKFAFLEATEVYSGFLGVMN